MAAAGKIRITLKRSPVSRIPKHRETLRALGLRRPNRSVVKPDTPVVRGMINTVGYMVEVEPVED
jgi:large subunit ribosomal protein L30